MDLVDWLYATFFWLYFASALPCSSSKSTRNEDVVTANRTTAGLNCIRGICFKLGPGPHQSCAQNTSCCNINGSNVFFDSTKVICCQGKLNLRPTNESLYCCGPKLYDPAESICCHGDVQTINPTNVHPRCCGRTVFDANKFICCRRKLRRRRLPHTACCRGRVIDITRQICCHGRQQYSTEGRSRCCGGTSYNPYKDSCCSNVLNSNIVTQTCCRTRAYDRAYSTCCQGNLHDAPNLSCCGPAAYDASTHLCCGGKVVKTNGTRTKCCCTGRGCLAFDSRRDICCGGNLERRRKTSEACCGTDMYDVNEQTCCGNITLGPETPSNWRCCHDTPYNNNIKMCCGGDVYLREGGRSRCCGNKAYNPSEIRCVDMLYSKLSPIGGRYCGRAIYFPETHICCPYSELTLTKIFGSSTGCCANKAYNTRRHVCCHGIISAIPSGIPRCCRTRVLNAFTQRCSRPTGDIVSMVDPRIKYCGTTMTEYDSRNHRCCEETLYGVNQACCQGRVVAAPGTHLGQGRCCNGRPYDRTQICCGGSLFPRGVNTRCCVRVAYNSTTHACCVGRVYPEGFTCCSDVVHPTPGTKLEQGRCCDGLGFNHDTQICCGNKIFRRKSKQVTCCGSRPYDPSRNLFICCNARLSPQVHARSRCCGKYSYDRNSDTCCKGRVYRRRNATCCGRKIFDQSTEICCEHINVYPIEKYGRGCCKAMAYNLVTETCRLGVVMRSSSQHCGKASYDAKTQFCCAERILAKNEHYECCSNRSYYTRDSICCGGKVYPKSTSVCCGDQAYDAGYYECCGPIPIARACGGHKCCSGRVYDSRKSKCRGMRVILRRNLRSKLCGLGDHHVVFLGYLSAAGESFRVIQTFKGTIPQAGLFKVKNSTLLKQRWQIGKRYLVAGVRDKSSPFITKILVLRPWRRALAKKVQKALQRCRRNRMTDTRVVSRLT